MDTDVTCDCPTCVGTWAEVGDGFDAWRVDVDSVPFAHEDYWTTDRVGELRTEDTR